MFFITITQQEQIHEFISNFNLSHFGCLFLSLHAHTHTHIYTGAHAHSWTQMPDEDVRCPPLSPAACTLEAGSLAQPGACVFSGGLEASKPWLFLSLLPSELGWWQS